MLKKSFYLVLKDIRNYVRQYSIIIVVAIHKEMTVTTTAIVLINDV